MVRWGVGPGGAGDVDDALGDGDCPLAGVDGAVVEGAEQGEVVEAGGSSVGPVDEVVGVAHPGWGVADDAAFVAFVEGSA